MQKPYTHCLRPTFLAGALFVVASACGGSGTGTYQGSGGTAGQSSGGASGTAPGGSSNSGGSTSGGSGGTIPYEQWRACTVDGDCVTVPQNTCCGCTPFGVNKTYESDARTEFDKFNAASCPPGLGCPSFPCPPDPVPICAEGQCSWKEGCSARSEMDCAMDGQCTPYRARPCGMPTEAFVACSRPTECIGVPTCALSPNAQQFMFPDNCLPEGWAECPSVCE
jgi:hypothetical protein